MVRIIDRRFDSRNKSAVNRQRFMRRFKQQIRKAVSEAIQGRSIRDLENGEQVSIPSRDLSEPSLHHGKGGIWEQVFAGNDQFSSGDRINRPLGGGAGGSGVVIIRYLTPTTTDNFGGCSFGSADMMTI